VDLTNLQLLLQFTRIPTLSVPGFEADDVGTSSLVTQRRAPSSKSGHVHTSMRSNISDEQPGSRWRGFSFMQAVHAAGPCTNHLLCHVVHEAGAADPPPLASVMGCNMCLSYGGLQAAKHLPAAPESADCVCAGDGWPCCTSKGCWLEDSAGQH
jgi:hypothetical protein